MSLRDEQLDRYARHIVLKDIGGTGQQRLCAASVTVIGAGGIGGPALLYLAAAGVGTLTIIDDDRIALSNLQRQILFSTAEVGEVKVTSAARRLSGLNPDVAVVPVESRINASNAEALLKGTGLVIDGSDNFVTRLAVADTAYRLRTPLVSAAIGQFHGQVATWQGWSSDQPCYRCYVGDAHDPDECDSCAELGVLGAMTGIVGSFAAMEAIRAITGFGEPSTGKLHLFDGLAPAMRTIHMPKDPACKTCGSG